MNIVGCILSPVIGFVVGIFFMGLFRIMMARIHWRYGPPLTQPIIDIIKLFHKKAFPTALFLNWGCSSRWQVV